MLAERMRAEVSARSDIMTPEALRTTSGDDYRHRRRLAVMPNQSSFGVSS